LPDVWTSREPTVVDLGDDLFTRGRPHPMIDHRLRNERILAEAADPGVAVLLLDVVLGYGAHPDPAAEMEPAIRSARDIATKHGREILFVGSVCGTAADPQDLSRQEAALRDAGVLLANSNAEAVRLAAAIVGGVRPAAQHRAEGGSRNG
jgi:FdrA protein